MRFLRNNGLSLAVIGLFLLTYLGGQVFTGWHTYNAERAEHTEPALTLASYLTSAHFVEATAENWESEFLQMFIYVYITVFLFQKGSAESNDPDARKKTRPVTDQSPWPVRKGGVWKKLYAHSLSLAFAVMFLISFSIHACSSVRLENEGRVRLGQHAITLRQHLEGTSFWFESFKNWQSEFLAIGSMIILSIYLREKDSPESKDVEAPHTETGG